jgi:cytochrome c oxidase subunit IV
MHSDPAEVKKTIRQYMMIGGALFAFTVITVLANRVHLAVPLAITVGLIIATIKGSMVAAVFMHLSNEKKWVYGSLILTVVFFAVLMLIPLFTISDSIGTHVQVPGTATHGSAPAAEHEGH